MSELDHKEGWTLKNCCFQIVVLEKTLESPLDCKEIKPVNPKGDQPWILIGSNLIIGWDIRAVQCDRIQAQCSWWEEVPTQCLVTETRPGPTVAAQWLSTLVVWIHGWGRTSPPSPSMMREWRWRAGTQEARGTVPQDSRRTSTSFLGSPSVGDQPPPHTHHWHCRSVEMECFWCNWLSTRENILFFFFF